MKALTLTRKPLFQIIKVHEDAQLPFKAHANDAGYDIFAYLSEYPSETIYPGSRLAVGVGIKVRPPENTYLRIAPRSGLAKNFGIDTLAGVFDRSCEREVVVILVNHGQEPFVVKHGDRIAQVILEVIQDADMVVVSEFEKIDGRGEGAFGSTGLSAKVDLAK
jgi:dUTP pyrophosphatase